MNHKDEKMMNEMIAIMAQEMFRLVRSELIVWETDGDKGFLVNPPDDELHFAFQWLPSSMHPKSKEAFVTLIGSNDHVLGARALGRSIEMLGTTKVSYINTINQSNMISNKLV